MVRKYESLSNVERLKLLESIIHNNSVSNTPELEQIAKDIGLENFNLKNIYSYNNGAKVLLLIDNEEISEINKNQIINTFKSISNDIDFIFMPTEIGRFVKQIEEEDYKTLISIIEKYFPSSIQKIEDYEEDFDDEEYDDDDEYDEDEYDEDDDYFEGGE